MAYAIKTNNNKNGSKTYFIMSITRIPNGNGKLKTQCVEKLNSDDLLRNGIDNPFEYAQSRLADWKNKALKERTELTTSVEIPLNQKLEVSDSQDVINLGYAVYSYLYHKLHLDELINARRQHTKREFNTNVIFQHLLYSRCLKPDSKLGFWENRKMFYGDTSYTLDDVYRCMDDLLTWREDILTHLDTQIKKQYKRRNSVVYYDVTNYYFEIDKEDSDSELRANGVNKEHRPNPIIQMGLFMDEKGLPVTYELFRGNTHDSQTFKEAFDKSIIDFKDSKKIIVADKGMMTYYNVLKIREAQNGYVISQSIKKSDADTQAFALNNEGWEITTDSEGQVIHMIKERTIPRKASSYGDVDSSKHSGTYNERQVFIWSKKYADKAKEERKAVIEKALNYSGTKSSDYRDSTYGMLKYVKKTPMSKGKTVSADKFIVELDQSAIDEDAKFDGFYLICTNVCGPESEDKINRDKSPDFAYYRKDGFLVLNHIVSPQEIANIYGGLWRIEETFKVTKTGMLNLRPVFHSKQDRIRTHFMICFIALVLERLLEYSLNWQYSAKSIQESLSSFNCVRIADSNIYQTFGYDQIANLIFKRYKINLQEKYLTQLKLRKFFGSTKKHD